MYKTKCCQMHWGVCHGSVYFGVPRRPTWMNGNGAASLNVHSVVIMCAGI